MQTQLSPSVRATPAGRDAEPILRACVHCGFCTATCPTYQLLGDELDGPRGRIYLIKNLLEGEAATRATQVHLDRCLTCLNCETTCPSGVKYHHLLDIGRQHVEQAVARPLHERLLRWGLRTILPYPHRLRPLLWFAQRLRPLLPAVLRDKFPPRHRPVVSAALRPAVAAVAVAASSVQSRDESRDKSRVECSLGAYQPRQSCRLRQVIVLDNCVEPLLTPATVVALERILAALDIQVMRASGAGCCGAIAAHLAAPEQAKLQIRRNIDAWWPLVEAGAEAILVSASGCGAAVKDYGWWLRDDPDYAARAAHIVSLAQDPSEYFSAEELVPLVASQSKRLAFHPPCTLQHGQQLPGQVEHLLREAGFELLPVQNSHSCCGSAGTYSILHSTLANQLRDDKLQTLEVTDPALIVTANVGCQTHLQTATARPVVHWLELFDPDG